MDFEAKVIMDLGMQTGTSKAGKAWKKKEYVLETPGMYPRKVKVTVFGDRCETILLTPGQNYRVSVDLESREFNGRWYTDVNVYAAQPLENAAGAPMGAAPAQAGFPAQDNGLGGVAAPLPPADPFTASDPTDDLPF